MAGVISGSVVGERGSEGLHFAVSEPSLSSKLKALGLRGYVVTPPGQYPEESDVPPASAGQQQGCVHPDAPRTTYLPEACIDGVPHARVGGQVWLNGEHAPDGTLLEAVVNGVVCGTSTTSRFLIAISIGCGGAETGTPIVLRYGGVEAKPYSGIGSASTPYTPKWLPRTRNCHVYCTESPGNTDIDLPFYTPASVEQVREYAQCVNDYWQESIAQISSLAWDSYDKLKHTGSGIAATMARTLRDGTCPQHQRVLLHDLAPDWHAAAVAYWHALRAYLYAHEEGDISARAKKRAEDAAFAEYKDAECVLWTVLGWECQADPTPTTDPTPATQEMVKEYVECALDYWREVNEQTAGASARSQASIAYQMAAYFREGGWDCQNRDRVLLDQLAKRWNDTAGHYFRAFGDLADATATGDISRGRKERVAEEALAAHRETECLLWPRLGWKPPQTCTTPTSTP